QAAVALDAAEDIDAEVIEHAAQSALHQGGGAIELLLQLRLGLFRHLTGNRFLRSQPTGDGFQCEPLLRSLSSVGDPLSLQLRLDAFFLSLELETCELRLSEFLLNPGGEFQVSDRPGETELATHDFRRGDCLDDTRQEIFHELLDRLRRERGSVPDRGWRSFETLTDFTVL